MYVLIVFNNYEIEDIDAVFGPFDTLEDAQAKQKELFGDTYRRASIHQLVEELPEWSR